ncbi:EcsC family protein [Adlercreutzia equolifaciens]|uniref:EcsC family protein n=1 Tax=Adlercreutzia equolifaciens TaxID=446660 RepID=UPI0023B0AFC7|nr:EcsC family protein [Adlercreutzia equolifaciens]MDE8702266.1 EcsC family protein [Adlercreutzia equolifaciens]
MADEDSWDNSSKAVEGNRQSLADRFVKPATSSIKELGVQVATKASGAFEGISSRFAAEKTADCPTEEVFIEAEVVDGAQQGEGPIGEDEAGRILAALYEKALDGIPKVSRSVEDLVKDYWEKSDSPEKAALALSKAQVAKCGTSGFLSGLGGVITLPVTIPANIGSVLYVQMRMVAAIAKLGGYDIRSDQVQTLVYMCLTGSAVTDVAKQVGIKVGNKTLEAAIKKIPGSALAAINKKVGFRLLTKFGEKGAINLGKMVPVAGGIIGGSVDVATTIVIAKNAMKVFIEDENPDGKPLTNEEEVVVESVKIDEDAGDERLIEVKSAGENEGFSSGVGEKDEGIVPVEKELELVVKLKELLDADVLTPEEFESKKKQIMRL